MDDAAHGHHVIELTALELAGLERAIPSRVPGGELALGDAAVSAFDIECRQVGSGYELVCEPEAFRALVDFVSDDDVRLRGGLDEDLDDAISKVDATAEEAS